ncbi:MAG: hypothetical protein EBX27_02995, partial [Proteobacteria bacterium]|nr:hypothetical protein [Pseudomonadota bacterium]
MIEKYHGSENSLCVIVKNSKEARLLKNELCLYIDPSFIRYFPENEILPYDHFSIPENILKERFTILNTLNKNKDIVISTVKNLFELYPHIDIFKSQESFSINTTISIGKLENILIALNYKKTNK